MLKERPTPAELAILKVLWGGGVMSAREVQAAIGEPQAWSVSTTRTLLSRMTEKGLVRRGEVHGLAVFEPAHSKAVVLGAMIRSFSAEIFDLDAPLPAQAFAHSPLLDPEDIEALEALLADDPGANQDDDR